MLKIWNNKILLCYYNIFRYVLITRHNLENIKKWSLLVSLLKILLFVRSEIWWVLKTDTNWQTINSITMIT